MLGDERLDEILRVHNPWWVSGALPQRVRTTTPRAGDRTLAEGDRPVLLTGPRCAGKTATLFRLVDRCLRAGRPRDVAYLPFDHPLLRLAAPGPLVDRALRLMDAAERPMVLLDGLQAVPQWPELFLELVRTRPQPRIVATASVAPEVLDPAFDVVVLPPLSFREFCTLKGLPDLGAPPLDPFAPALPEVADAADDRLFQRVLDPVLADYLVRGGFPESVYEPDLAEAYRRVREDVVARAVYQDLPAVVGVAKVAEVERVLCAALLQGGAPINVEAFADAVALDRHTVQRYLDHVARVHLLLGLKNFAASTDRSRTRVFAADPALPNALFERGPAVLARPDERRGLLVATLVTHVQRLARERGFDLAYFRDGDLEADVVLVGPSGAVPVVYVDRDDATEEDAVQVERILKRTQARAAFLLSRAGPRVKAPLTFFETVYHLPAAYFLYALEG